MQIGLIIVTFVIAVIGQLTSEKPNKRLIVITIVLLIVASGFQVFIVAEKDKDDIVRNQRLDNLVTGNDSLLARNQSLLIRYDSLSSQNQSLLMKNDSLLRKVTAYQDKLDEYSEDTKTIKEFYHVAQLDPYGKTVVTDGSIRLTTGISRIMEPTIENKDGTTYFKCDEESVGRYKETIEKFPRFPFSYYGMAICLLQKRNDKWRDYANQAVNIFKRTVEIEGHKDVHGQALAFLLRQLETYK